MRARLVGRRRALIAATLSACGGSVGPGSSLPPPPAIGAASTGVTSTIAEGPFTSRAPESTRMLIHWRGRDVDTLLTLEALRELRLSTMRCRLSPGQVVDTVDLAIGTDAAAYGELVGRLTIDDVRCLIDPGPGSGAVRYGAWAFVDGGITPDGRRVLQFGHTRSLRGGAGAPADIAERFLGLAANGAAIVAWPEGSEGSHFEVSATETSINLDVIWSDDASPEAGLGGFTSWWQGAQARWETALGPLAVEVDDGRVRATAARKLDADVVGTVAALVGLHGIDGDGMLPALWSGDVLLFTRQEAPKRGDVVVYGRPTRGLSKELGRVVALPSERVTVSDQGLELDNKPLPTWRIEAPYRPPSYAANVPRAPAELWGEMLEDVPRGVVRSPPGFGLHDLEAFRATVPPDHLFILGDYRDNSLDSRKLGAIALEGVDGVGRMIVWSIDDGGRVRWERLGVPAASAGRVTGPNLGKGQKASPIQ